ncbi:arylesterase [Sphingobacterium bambusae]|uniref:Arylesterase n=1 Tax=Sphingobacterium bambusae TaxID=662858 RepID=A0ABW6BDG7_9SPHI|nr:arylesterase [Sphingobacterium bambusae]WPL48329.1 arylesterase [Sphingobacterium bambusae]
MISLYRRCFFLFVVIFSISCSNTNSSSGSTAENSDSDSTQQSQNNPSTKSKTILFFGDSLTAGYGLEDPKDAFPELIQAKIDSLNLPYTVVNAGLSGETSAGGNERIDWLLQNPVDIFILELGANDGLRGIDPTSTYENLRQIVQKVKEKYPSCQLVLAGMLVPPNVGEDYFGEFKALFPKLAKEQQMELIPFLLDGVAGQAPLNQADGIHPTEAGQVKVADNVWKVLQPLLKG